MRISMTKSIVVVIAVICGVLFSNVVGFTDRMGKMICLESSSANVRYDLYSAGLKMLTDAPAGFCEPNTPAKAYMRWYQRMYENEEYNTLVNSHLEFLNRHGIIYKFSYILFWSFIFSITFSYKKSILSSVAFSIWIAFFLNSIFSNIATFWIMWILPILYLLLVIFVNRGKFLDKRFYYTILSIFIISILALFTTSLALNRDVNLHFQKDNVKLGTSLPSEVFIYLQNDSVLGRKYGLELIDWIKGKNLTVTIGTQPNNSILYRTMVVAGKFNTKDILKSNSERYVFLNPTFENEKLHEILMICRARFGDPSLNIKTLSGELNLDRTTLLRIFRKKMNISPSEYLSMLRLQRALSLLQNPRLSLSEIAEQSGFRDSNYFCRFIRKNTGKRPSQWR